MQPDAVIGWISKQEEGTQSGALWEHHSSKDIWMTPKARVRYSESREKDLGNGPRGARFVRLRTVGYRQENRLNQAWEAVGRVLDSCAPSPGLESQHHTNQAQAR